MRPIHLWAATSIVAVAIAGHAALDYTTRTRTGTVLNNLAALSERLDKIVVEINRRAEDTRNDLAVAKYDLRQDVAAAIRTIEDRSATHAAALHGLQQDVAWIHEELGKGNPRVPTVKGLSWQDISGKQVKILPGPLKMDLDTLAAASLRYRIGRALSPEEIPVKWPETYIKTYKQEFNPYTFALNCSAIAEQIQAKNGDWSRIIEYLLGQLAKYTNDKGEIFYDFDYVQGDGVLKAGWTSAFANGAVAIGLLQLYDATQNQKYLDLAKRYLGALKWNGTNTGILRLDDSSYLWFEETPPINGRPTSVHNGHVMTVLALYYYQQVTGDTSFEPHLRAGLATAARYLPEARRPGRPPAYGRFGEIPDYGPLRAHNQAKILAEMTGNAAFSELVDALKTDIPIR